MGDTQAGENAESEGGGQGEVCIEEAEGDASEDGDGRGGADGDVRGGDDAPLGSANGNAREPEVNNGKRGANIAHRLEMDRLQYESRLATQQSTRVTRAQHRKHRVGSFASDVMPQDSNDLCGHAV
jgi:hypothetical protein